MNLAFNHNIVSKSSHFLQYFDTVGEDATGARAMQYFKTGKFFPTSQTKLRFECMNADYTNSLWNPMMGSRSAYYSTDSFDIHTQAFESYYNIAWCVNGTSRDAAIRMDYSSERLDIQLTVSQLKVNDIIVSTGKSSIATSGLDIWILSANEKGHGMDGGCWKGRFFHASIEEAGVLIADFYPCIDNNGVVCLYDTISDEPLYMAEECTIPLIAGPIASRP